MAKKILVIDDEELIIRSLAKLLEKSGYETFIAKTGRDAIVMVEEEDFNLIISDIRMPGLNGIEAVKAIYQFLDEKGERRPPVIFITGYADKECENEAKALDPIDYIYKPFDIADLVGRIKNTLGE
ncbi:MAG: response regulator [Candidatus Omnitrophica bacterium]|nr:response regulator [Candidatus Omnitrophota bacterium]